MVLLGSDESARKSILVHSFHTIVEYILRNSGYTSIACHAIDGVDRSEGHQGQRHKVMHVMVVARDLKKYCGAFIEYVSKAECMLAEAKAI